MELENTQKLLDLRDTIFHPGFHQGNDRHQAWEKIRDTIPTAFYSIVSAKKLEKEIRLSKPPSLKGQVNFTPWTELELQYREVERLDGLLLEERAFTERKQQEFSQRWELACEKQQDLDKILRKFSIYYEECQLKVERDRALCRQYEREKEKEIGKIRKLQRQLLILQRVKEVTGRRRDLCEPYKDYLLRVVHTYNKCHPGDQPFKNIQEWLERFDYLRKIREEKGSAVICNWSLSVDNLGMENKERNQSSKEEQAYRAHTVKLMDYREKLEGHVGKMNVKAVAVKASIKEEILQAERPKAATYALYCNLAKVMGQQVKVKESNVPGQLRFVGKFLLEMKKIPGRVRQTLELGRNGDFYD